MTRPVKQTQEVHSNYTPSLKKRTALCFESHPVMDGRQARKSQAAMILKLQFSGLLLRNLI